jgi:hypothetical protein
VNDIAIVTGSSVSAYNGVYKVSAVNSATTFEYTGVTCGAAATGGTVVKQVVDIGNSGVYGPSSANGVAPDSSPFLTPNAISPNGRFIVGLAYSCVYNTNGTFGTATGPGTTISANSFYWRPVLWDAQGNAGAGSLVVLPTPFKTSSLTRRRTGNPYAVSNNGLVIAGATEHNVGASANADPDGGRFCVWRWNSGTSSFDLTYLDTGVDANGFPRGISSTPGSLAMNAAGTIIVARGPDGITKWTWNGSTWGAPTIIGSNLSAPASWLPAAVTSCAIPPNIGGTLAMSDDGNVIVGSAVYSTCQSFMSGGFIWTSADNTIMDWYDYLRLLNTPGVAAGGIYGPVGDLGDTSKGLPALGYPLAISPDGNAVTCAQLGTQRIVGAAPTIVLFSGGPSCVGPSITNNPAATTNFSACTSSIILNVAASGTGPFTYQWYKNGSPLADGATGNGSTLTGATSFQFRINGPYTPADAGTYYAVVTGQCGSPAQSTNAVVQVDPAVPAAINDTCATAVSVNQGNNVVTTGNNPCGSFVNDPLSTPSCAPASGTKSDCWFVFTPSTSGNYRFDTCDSNYDTVMSLYAGSCGTSELACNNDYNTGPSTGCSSVRSRVSSVALTASTPYYICVAAAGNAFLTSGSSVINLSINLAPPLPANDFCNTPATAVLGVNAYNTTEATQDGSVVSTCSSGSATSRDVWFLYTPTQPGRLTASTCPTGTAPAGYSLMTNTVLSFHSGPCGADLTCNDNHTPVPAGCGSSLSTISRYPVQTGNALWIRVAGSSTTTFGAGQLSLTLGCVADVDDGNSTGTPDGGVGIEDLLYYLGRYDLGVAAADVDNGTGTGTPDGGVGIEDLLFYLDRYDVGC